MVDDRQGRRGGRRPRSAAADNRPAFRDGPAIPPGIHARQLAPEIRRELSTLDRATADAVACHLVAAGELIDDDPEAALRHARAARGSGQQDRRCARSCRNRRLPLRRLGAGVGRIAGSPKNGEQVPPACADRGLRTRSGPAAAGHRIGARVRGGRAQR
ncbi:conserved hypothetical protein [Mycobacterium tuberculosis 02_1987]|nr:conserved hypothetical protein [Mycobacterium tuberculosis 02_1987]